MYYEEITLSFALTKLMKKKRLLVIVERGKGKGNFSCFATENVGNCGLFGYGRTAREAMEDIQVSVQECREMAAEEGEDFPDEIEFDFRLDVGSFFDYYPLDVTATAKYIGINPSVLRQYVSAIREPQQKQIDKIKVGLEGLVHDLGTGLKMIDKPAVSYIQ